MKNSRPVYVFSVGGAVAPPLHGDRWFHLRKPCCGSFDNPCCFNCILVRVTPWVSPTVLFALLLSLYPGCKRLLGAPTDRITCNTFSAHWSQSLGTVSIFAAALRFVPPVPVVVFFSFGGRGFVFSPPFLFVLQNHFRYCLPHGTRRQTSLKLTGTCYHQEQKMCNQHYRLSSIIVK